MFCNYRQRIRNAIVAFFSFWVSIKILHLFVPHGQVTYSLSYNRFIVMLGNIKSIKRTDYCTIQIQTVQRKIGWYCSNIHEYNFKAPCALKLYVPFFLGLTEDRLASITYNLKELPSISHFWQHKSFWERVWMNCIFGVTTSTKFLFSSYFISFRVISSCLKQLNLTWGPSLGERETKGV